MIYNMINVGEESGLLDDILTKTAAFYDEESDAASSVWSSAGTRAHHFHGRSHRFHRHRHRAADVFHVGAVA